MSEIATFGAGCFWGVEAAFQRVPGVIETAVGYSGGETVNPTYKDVCTDETGHAEVVQVTFDPAKVSYEQLLDVFWQVHDPTQVNRQGPDFGTQYRTAIFFHSPEQEAAAKKSRAALDASGRFKRPIATEITPAGTFHRAENITKNICRSAAQPPAISKGKFGAPKLERILETCWGGLCRIARRVKPSLNNVGPISSG
jgi:peptide-methionine (S)-S-oxide reductase